MPEDFDPGCHGLTRLSVARRHGVVFATASAETPPLESALGEEMLRWFDRVFDGRPLRVLGYLRQRIPANWKLMMENIKDPYHASLLHVFLVTFGLFRADQPSEVRMDETGGHAVLLPDARWSAGPTADPGGPDRGSGTPRIVTRAGGRLPATVAAMPFR